MDMQKQDQGTMALSFWIGHKTEILRVKVHNKQ